MIPQPEVRAAVADALEATRLTAADGGAAALALHCAGLIDDGADPAKYGRVLLATLTALGMTPAGRAKLGEDGADDQPDALDELRRRRERTG